MPLWLFTVLVFVTMSGCAIGGLFLVHRFVRRENELTHNDVAGPIISTLGTVLAVMLSFMVVAVWQEYDQAAATVQTESSALADLYHRASVLPQTPRTLLRQAIRGYVDTVIHDEWPLMRDGRSSQKALRKSIQVVELVERYAPDTMSLAYAFSDARRQRLFDNEQAIPIILWVMMIFIAALTIASSFLFYVRRFRMHATMTLALTLVIAAVFVLIAEFDLPFRGELQIPPSAYNHVYSAIAADPS